MKKVITTILILFLTFSPAFAFSVIKPIKYTISGINACDYDDVMKNKEAYMLYLEDIHDNIKKNIDKEEIIKIARKYPNPEANFLLTIRADGTIEKCTRYEYGRVTQTANTKFHQEIYKAIEAYKFKPFNEGMHIKKVRIEISCSLNHFFDKPRPSVFLFVRYVRDYHNIFARFAAWQTFGRIPVPPGFSDWNRLLMLDNIYGSKFE